ncbi:MAG: hypothetical protein KR126chlam6_00687 [Candidatus Anoxychlamydiales bacterium]|nr:hypothetical protein [Candidatus Anoxychlamydiales bacterium]
MNEIIVNEVLFFSHIVVVILFLLVALRLGKNYLFAICILGSVLANLFVIKQIDLFHKTVTSTDVFIIAAIFSENLLQEYFGKKEALKAIKISFFSMLFFIVMAKVHLLYTPSVFDNSHSSFLTILSATPRIMLSSIFVFFLAQRLDVLFFAFLKKLFNAKYLPLRMVISSVIVQLIDTVLFSYLALFGKVHQILDIIFFSFLIKSLVIILIAPFMKFSKFFMKKESYDEI